MGEANRLPAQGPVAAYQTFSVRSRPDKAVRTVCERIGCPAWLSGWESVIDERTALGQAQAAYIRGESGRTFREQRRGDGLTVFRFEARQRCFADHQTIPELYLVRDGDHRGNPSGRRRLHQNPADWVEHMQEEFGRLEDDRRRG
ncbi:hypothetical protein ABZY90_19545 [Streptomyces sp. NPDC006422]|uniref:hypothetical protein n=1 Tax=unclassified Streptomyces TaxID=2593676 RepID=UPI0033B3EB0F